MIQSDDTVGGMAVVVGSSPTNGRTLRTLVQFVRSGQFGRKSLAY
jgi:hypothetical protein